MLKTLLLNRRVFFFFKYTVIKNGDNKLIGAEGAIATRRLTARPKESEYPGAEINLSHCQITTKFMKTAFLII
jgi:hypothetical protein